MRSIAVVQPGIAIPLATLCVLLGFWLVGHLQSFQYSYELRSLFRNLSFSLHYGHFVQGLVRSESIAFYLAVCAVALSLNTAVLEWRR